MARLAGIVMLIKKGDMPPYSLSISWRFPGADRFLKEDGALVHWYRVSKWWWTKSDAKWVLRLYNYSRSKVMIRWWMMMLTMKRAWREMVVWDGESPRGVKSDCLNVDWTIIFVIVDDHSFDSKSEKEKKWRCPERHAHLWTFKSIQV